MGDGAIGVGSCSGACGAVARPNEEGMLDNPVDSIAVFVDIVCPRGREVSHVGLILGEIAQFATALTAVGLISVGVDVFVGNSADGLGEALHAAFRHCQGGVALPPRMLEWASPVLGAVVVAESAVLVGVILASHGVDESLVDETIAIVVDAVADLDGVANVTGAPGIVATRRQTGLSAHAGVDCA